MKKELAIAKNLVYTVAETAQVLKISTKTAYELVKTEGFPAIQISPGRTVVSCAGLERWIEAQLPAQEDKR